MPALASRLIAWQRRQGRHHLPWQNTRDAYRIWLSEIMLQQTQVTTVIAYYERFVQSFPTVQSLAAAPLARVLEHWSGLGYYRRAHHLHAAAQTVVNEHNGVFPDTQERLMILPGVGRSTAAAIAVFAFGQRAAILDGNVRRLLARHQGIEGFPGLPDVEKTLWALAEQLLPKRHLEAYTQGLMDLGSQICTRSKPLCAQCPLRDDCVAYHQNRVHELPTPRSGKAPVRRDFCLLMLRRNGRVLLEARANRGIWSGLWSFPECDVGDNFAALIRARWGLTLIAKKAQPVMVHPLTHRTLHITPILATVRGRLSSTTALETRFFSLSEARQCALPAPVRRLLAQ
ncbi:MAG: A/G-specific adenine glycosylase [Proteobacteria bacterium]|nr:A/G-specific adenine glycosylase [Pseudomonadota bacterium]MCL2308186.1 A/G-specific adenine glycosylase [Pseudomonadota bacterium]